MLFLFAKNKSGLHIVDYYCHFHPLSPAKWRCTNCSRLFDNACLSSADEKNQNGQCPFCKTPLTFLPSETIFKEGSSKLKKLALQSLSPESFLLLASSALIASLSALANIGTSLSFIAVLFINLHFGRKYVFQAYSLKLTGNRTRSSRTRLKKSPLAMLSAVTSLQLTVVASLLLLLPIYTFYHLHWLIGLILIFAAGLCLPFLIIFSLHSNENDQGITLTKLSHELKPHAPKLALFSFYAFGLSILTSDLAWQLCPPVIAITISATLAMISLTLVLHASTELFLLTIRKLSAHGTKKESDNAPKGPGTLYSQEQIANLDTDIDIALKTGQYEQVISLLEEALKRNGQSNLRRQQLYLLLNEANDLSKLARYAELFLDWMLERNKIKEASQFIYRLRKQDPSFILHDLVLMHKLSKQFLRTKKYALALWLAEGTQQRFNPSEELAGVLLGAAQAFITHYQDLAKAEELLLFIFQSCSDYPSAEAAKALLIHLQNNQKRQQDLKT